jgi:hypothetical protein
MKIMSLIISKLKNKMKNKQNPNKLNLSFSKEELADRRIIDLIKKLVDVKINVQRFKDFITISPAEYEVIRKFTDFVPKENYNSKITFKGEIGKIRGRRVVVNDF